MSVLSYKNGGYQIDSLTTLINESYRDHPQYAASRVGMITKSLAAVNPFFRHGHYKGFLAYSGNRPMAHTCAIVDGRLPGVGLIGFFESLNEGTYARTVIQEAIGYLVNHGTRTIRGPVDLTTWNGFRLSYPDVEPPFFLEPFTRAYYRAFFRELGFSVAQRNVSTVHTADQVGFNRFKAYLETLQSRGFVFERVEEHQLANALPLLHKLLLRCFADTWSFVPISFEEFQYTFIDLTQAISEILVYMAYTAAGEPVGFCLGALDWPWNGKRVVVKSIAVVPMKRRLEVARALLYCAYAAANERGASEFILSTMRDDNKRVGALIPGVRPPYRQYEVYELDLRGVRP